jgi:DnaJ-class molecular chaperone
VKIPQPVDPNYVHVLKGQGMPKMNKPGHHGDLLIKFTYLFPKTLTAEKRREIERVFGGVEFEQSEHGIVTLVSSSLGLYFRRFTKYLNYFVVILVFLGYLYYRK